MKNRKIILTKQKKKTKNKKHFKRWAQCLKATKIGQSDSLTPLMNILEGLFTPTMGSLWNSASNAATFKSSDGRAAVWLQNAKIADFCILRAKNEGFWSSWVQTVIFLLKYSIRSLIIRICDFLPRLHLPKKNLQDRQDCQDEKSVKHLKYLAGPLKL